MIGTDVWVWLRGIEYIAPARSPLIATVFQMRLSATAPIYKLLQRLPDNQYRVVLTRVQLERVLAAHYGATTQ